MSAFYGRAGFVGLGYRSVSFGYGGEGIPPVTVPIPVACFDGTISPVVFSGSICSVGFDGNIDPVSFSVDLEECD